MVRELAHTVALRSIGTTISRKGAHMANYKVGYFVGSLATTFINRTLAKALVKLTPSRW